MFPETLMLGMEIRVKVSDYVQDRITALRTNHPGQYQNIACLRTNSMKYMPNYFRKAQVNKTNICVHTPCPSVLFGLTDILSWNFIFFHDFQIPTVSFRMQFVASFKNLNEI